MFVPISDELLEQLISDVLAHKYDWAVEVGELGGGMMKRKVATTFSTI